MSSQSYAQKQSYGQSSGCGCGCGKPQACSLSAPVPYVACCHPAPFHRGACGGEYFMMGQAYGGRQ